MTPEETLKEWCVGVEGEDLPDVTVTDKDAAVAIRALNQHVKILGERYDELAESHEAVVIANDAGTELLRRAEQRVKAALALHQDDEGDCTGCGSESPCPTVKALRGEASVSVAGVFPGAANRQDDLAAAEDGRPAMKPEDMTLEELLEGWDHTEPEETLALLGMGDEMALRLRKLDEYEHALPNDLNHLNRHVLRRILDGK